MPADHSNHPDEQLKYEAASRIFYMLQSDIVPKPNSLLLPEGICLVPDKYLVEGLVLHLLKPEHNSHHLSRYMLYQLIHLHSG